MAIHNTNWWDNFIRGGNQFWQRMTMFLKNFVRAAIMFVAIFAGICVASFFLFTSYNVRASALAHVKAVVLDTFYLSGTSVAIELEDEKTGDLIVGTLPAREIRRSTRSGYLEAKSQVIAAFIPSFLFAIVVIAILVFRQARYGRKLAEDTSLRGAELVSDKELVKMIERPSPFKLGIIPIPITALSRGILMAGAPGSGKTQSVLHILDTCRQLGVKTLVYDNTGEFTEIYYRPGKDHILNIFDKRCEPWTVFADLRKDFDYSAFSTFFIPESKGKDPVWDNSARTLLEDVLRIVSTGRAGPRTMARVREILIKTPLPELTALLRQFDATSMGTITDKNVGTSESVRFTLSALPAIKCFDYLPIPEPGVTPFSVRNWVRGSDDGWLFIPSQEDLHDAIKPFISFWIELALLGTMTLRPTRGERTSMNCLLVLDELASLPAMRGLSTALERGSKFGTCTLVTLQSISQGEDVYGKEKWATLLGTLQNKLVFRVSDAGTAKEYADLLGKREIAEANEGSNFGPEASRDGGNLSHNTKEPNIVTFSEIIGLPDRTGYVRLAGAYPVAKTVVDWKNRPPINEAFVVRDGIEVKFDDLPTLPPPGGIPTAPAVDDIPDPNECPETTVQSLPPLVPEQTHQEAPKSGVGLY